VHAQGPSDEAKALALIDSGLADSAAVYMITTIGDEPANIEAMKTVPDSVFETLGVTARPGNLPQ
jgi:hypothetical protein